MDKFDKEKLNISCSVANKFKKLSNEQKMFVLGYMEHAIQKSNEKDTNNKENETA